MKHLHEIFTEEEHTRLKVIKEYLEIKNWHDFIIQSAEKYIVENPDLEMILGDNNGSTRNGKQ